MGSRRERSWNASLLSLNATTHVLHPCLLNPNSHTSLYHSPYPSFFPLIPFPTNAPLTVFLLSVTLPFLSLLLKKRSPSTPLMLSLSLFPSSSTPSSVPNNRNLSHFVPHSYFPYGPSLNSPLLPRLSVHTTETVVSIGRLLLSHTSPTQLSRNFPLLLSTEDRNTARSPNTLSNTAPWSTFVHSGRERRRE